MAALQGADGALAAHRKVPGEILLAYLFAGSLGQIVEHVARLPFALAGVGAVLAFYSLARQLLGGLAALVAGLLLAVNGYFVAFGRILQYDSLAFFLGIVGLICCWRFGQTAHATDADDRAPDGPDGRTAARRSSGRSSARCCSPAPRSSRSAPSSWCRRPLVLAWPGLVQHARAWPGARSWQVLLAWGWPVVPALLAAFMVLGAGGPTEGPSGIWSYLGPRFGGDRPYWHGALFVQSANHYLSSPYLLTMLGAGALAMVLGLVRRRLRGSTAEASSSGSPWPSCWPPSPGTARAPPSPSAPLLALVLVLQAPGRRHGPALGMRVALVWAAGPSSPTCS